MSQAVRKPCFSTSIPRGQNPRFPDAAGAGGGAPGQTLRSHPDPYPNTPRDEILPQGKPSLLNPKIYLYILGCSTSLHGVERGPKMILMQTGAQAGPTWVGPSWAQVGGPTPVPSGWAQAGPKWAQARNLGPQKIKKSKILKIKIRSAQNVGKVFSCRKKASPPHLGPSRPIFCVGRKNPKIAKILPIFLGGPMGPIHPVWGPCCYPPEVGQ